MPAGLLLVLLLAGGCASGSYDLAGEVEETAVRSEAPRLGPIHVKLRSDKRPLEQHGNRKYLGLSYLPASRLQEPTSVSLVRVITRDLLNARVTRAASLRPQEQPLILEVDILHLFGAFGEGLENLTIILPTSGIQGRCVLRVRFKDRDGRLYLDETYEGTAEGMASLLVGLEESAVRRLAEAIRAAVDQLLPAVGSSVVRFWEEQGRPPPAFLDGT